MEALGGPGNMAAAMTAAQEGEFAELASAGTECGLEMGPPPSAGARHSSTGAHTGDNRAHTVRRRR